MSKKILTLLLLIPFSASALTLYEWYNGALPSVQERTPMFNAFFPDEAYRGTAEQNTRFVSALTAGYMADEPEPIVLGAQNPVGGERYFLSGSGVSATQATLGLTKLGYTRPDGSYIKLTMTDFGTLGCGTIQPANNSGKQEFVSFTGITQNADNSATLTGVVRGLLRVSPFTASTTMQTAHSGGSDFVISNSPPCFYENYLNDNNDAFITGIYTFNTPPIATTTATSSNQLVNKSYVDSVAISGAATSTYSAQGIVRLASQTQVRDGVGTSTDKGGEPLVISSQRATSTPYMPSYGNIPATNADGQIAATFIATSSSYTWGASTTFSGNVNIGGVLTTAGQKISTTTSIGSSTPFLYDANGNGMYFGFPSVAQGVATQAIGTTGNQIITHGLGRIPYNIEINAHSVVRFLAGSASFCGIATSFGHATSTSGATQSAVFSGNYFTGPGTEQIVIASTTQLRIIQFPDNGAEGEIEASAQLTAMTSTTFTLNWDVNDAAVAACTDTGKVRAFHWKAY